MKETEAYLEFIYNFNRVEAFFTEVCAVQNDLTDSIRELAAELAIIQLVAVCDAYRLTIMSFILENDMNWLLSSKQEISYPDILEIGNWEGLIQEVIRREVTVWMQSGYGKWIDRLRKENVLPLLNISPEDRNQLEEVIATRNVIVHNKGTVDEEYLRRATNWYGIQKQPMPILGSKLSYDAQYFLSASSCIKRVVKAIEHAVVSML